MRIGRNSDMMKRTVAAILAGFLAVSSTAVLTACAPHTPEEETTTGAEVTQPSAETEATRFDYFDAYLPDYVTIDPSAYATATFTLPDDLRTDEKDVEVYIRYTQYSNREAVNGTEQVTDKPLDWGDDAYVYYRVLIDGKEIASASRMNADEPTRIGLGSTQLTPLEEALVGVVPAETSRENPARFEITFPNSYGRTALAGKDAVVEAYVAYSIQYTLPELTWKFITETLQYEPRYDYNYDVEDAAKVKEFREWVMDYLVVQNQNTVNTAKQNLIWDALLEVAEFKSLPEEEINYYYNLYLDNMRDSYETHKTQYPTMNDFAPVYMDLPVGADWETALREKVERMVKIEMLAFAIAKTEGLDTVSEEELQREIELWKEMYSSNVPVTDEEVKENVGLPMLYRQAISYKVQTFLLERMSFVYAEK